MTDRYENIRRALAMGPTPGPWKVVKDEPFGPRVDAVNNPHGSPLAFGIAGDILGDRRGRDATGGTPDSNAAHIAACDPDTIRALLAERDALENRVAQMLDALRSAEALAFCCMAEDCYSRREIRDMAEASAPRYTAAIAAENGGGNE